MAMCGCGLSYHGWISGAHPHRASSVPFSSLHMECLFQSLPIPHLIHLQGKSIPLPAALRWRQVCGHFLLSQQIDEADPDNRLPLWLLHTGILKTVHFHTASLPVITDSRRYPSQGTSYYVFHCRSLRQMAFHEADIQVHALPPPSAWFPWLTGYGLSQYLLSYKQGQAHAAPEPLHYVLSSPEFPASKVLHSVLPYKRQLLV